VTDAPGHAGDRLLQRAIAALVVAQAAVVGLQVIGRHLLFVDSCVDLPKRI
jgi:hypothetical protein